jgi:beta-glucosidase
MRKRFEQSAVRLLMNIFRTGLFEHPYLDPHESSKLVGNTSFMREGYEAQLKSVVMLKNAGNLLPLKKGVTVYMPKVKTPAIRNWFGQMSKESIDYPVKRELLTKYFNVTDDPSKADLALVFVRGPMAGTGYDSEDLKSGGNGYVPVSLQYRPYTATLARAQSLAAGDPLEPGNSNRSYKGKTVKTPNENDLDVILDTRKAMAGKPVVVVMSLSNPAVVAEFEKEVSSVLIGFGVQHQAFLDLISGKAEPSGLLPFQMPASMEEVENQNEDLPRDMKAHKDAAGNIYEFGYGMNWKGVIRDARVKKYAR